MRLKKSLLLVAGVVILAGLVIGGLVYLNSDIQRVWNDENTWDRTDVISIKSGVKFVDVTTEGSQKSYEIPYCLLYETKVDGDNVEYDCSFQPYYHTAIAQLHFKAGVFAPDVKFIVSKDSPLPTEFLDASRIDAEIIKTQGADPVPVTLRVVTNESGKKDGFSQRLAHYFEVKGGKSTKVPQQIVSWEVIKYTTDGKDLTAEDLKLWADSMAEVVNADVDLASLKKLQGFELFNALRDRFMFQFVKCNPTDTPCDRIYDENPASNIMLYLYGLQNKNDSFVTTFLNEANKKMAPFAQVANKDFKFTTKCNAQTDTKCVEDYQDMQAYEFPVCPIREIIAKDYSSNNVKLFMNFMELYATSPKTNKYMYTEKELKAGLVSYGTKKFTSGDATVLNPDAVSELNRYCYGMVYYNLKDAATLQSFEKAYVNVLSTTYGFIDNDLADNPLTSFSDFKTIVARSMLQSSTDNYASHERLALFEAKRGLENRSDLFNKRVYYGSIPLTLLLIYLYQ